MKEKGTEIENIINDLRDIQLTLSRLSPEVKRLSKKTYTVSSMERVMEMLHIIRLDLEES